jgi:hypothetical protein
MLEFWVDPESPYAKPVFAEPKRFLLYCASGWRSALAAKTVRDMGLPNVAHVGGGYTAWKKGGGLVEMMPPRWPQPMHGTNPNGSRSSVRFPPSCLSVGATTPVTPSRQPNELGKTRALNDFMIFGTTATTSFLAGFVRPPSPRGRPPPAPMRGGAVTGRRLRPAGPRTGRTSAAASR